MEQTWDVTRQREVVHALDSFQTWTSRWSSQMEHFYEDWLDSMLLLESRSGIGIRLTETETDQLFNAIERAQLHDLLRQHVEHVQAYLERSRDRYGWNTRENDLKQAFTANMYPFVRAIDVLTAIVGKSIERMQEELDYWQNVFGKWGAEQELYKVWPEMDLRFSDMQSVLYEGRAQIAGLRDVIMKELPELSAESHDDVDQAVVAELQPLLKRLRSVYERQFASEVVNEFELHVGSREGDVELYEESAESNEDDGIHYRIGDQLSIYAIKSEHRRMLESVQPLLDLRTGVCVADGSQVMDVDASGIQLLLSLAQTCREHGVRFRLSEPSDVLSHWLDRAGAAAFFK